MFQIGHFDFFKVLYRFDLITVISCISEIMQAALSFKYFFQSYGYNNFVPKAN